MPTVSDPSRLLYDADPHVAEIYDAIENYTDDLALLRDLIGDTRGLRILEPFCGTGRLAVPLAADGHLVVGLDRAKGMLNRGRAKVALLDPKARKRITLFRREACSTRFPPIFDLVLLGANALYEMESPEEQASCIRMAASALRPGGFVFLDNDHMEGDLPEDWTRPGVRAGAFPTGTCADGTRLEGTMEAVWWDAPNRLVRFARRVEITTPDGRTTRAAWTQQKHPPSTAEMETWLSDHGFSVRKRFGDRRRGPYGPDAERAILWACRDAGEEGAA